jgi:hypothetical protein
MVFFEMEEIMFMLQYCSNPPKWMTSGPRNVRAKNTEHTNIDFEE